jgi:hypothetical protein
MMQYMDKLALSQSTLFGLREDLVLFIFLSNFTSKPTTPSNMMFSTRRAYKIDNTTGPLLCSTSDISPGVGPAHISLFVCHLENTLASLFSSGVGFLCVTPPAQILEG